MCGKTFKEMEASYVFQNLPTQTTFQINRKSNAILITMFTGREERMS